ncbi:MAG: hypothetical protein AVDCRST_MAG30-3099, partial [uncultured Solirubrobacteraceae bacterium]
ESGSRHARTDPGAAARGLRLRQARDGRLQPARRAGAARRHARRAPGAHLRPAGHRGPRRPCRTGPARGAARPRDRAGLAAGGERRRGRPAHARSRAVVRARLLRRHGLAPPRRAADARRPLVHLRPRLEQRDVGQRPPRLRRRGPPGRRDPPGLRRVPPL